MRRIKLPSFANSANSVVEEEPTPPELPKDIRALELLQMTYRGEVKPTAQQMRAAIESLPYENPKLSAMAVTSMSANDFASRLDRCIERSSEAKLIEARAEPTD
jgi:hypothetical protein